MTKFSKLPIELSFREAIGIYVDRLIVFVLIAIVASIYLLILITFHLVNMWLLLFSIIPVTSVFIALIKRVLYRKQNNEISARSNYDILESKLAGELADIVVMNDSKGKPTTSEVNGRKSPYAIRIIGVGGAGQNSLNRMIEENIRGVEYIAVNTDVQGLALSKASTKILIGKEITHARELMSAGGNPEIGRKAAEESSDELYNVLKGADMVFITAGMGGGTGTGAAPVVAQIAKECGALTIGIVSRPFTFEGGRRTQSAEGGIIKLKEHTDTLIVIPNDRLLQLADKRSSLQNAFRMADEVLYQGVQAISELITVPGIINLDFTDIRAIIAEGGAAFMAVGKGKGEDRAKQAAEAAITSQLLDITIDGARGVLFNVTGGSNLTLFEVNQVAAIIRETAHPDVNMIFGAVIDPKMGDEIRVTVIATGFGKNDAPRRLVARMPHSQTTKFEKEQTSVQNNLKSENIYIEPSEQDARKSKNE